ncbi:hypothetical protein N7527_005318 [Penicillium freii]|uniref:U4/U6.U5 small nuclear ribonucleoprotein 27kDa protein domain-containing protein n=1 Tax=Penicillium freii TaxID=48697 RepID=A0A117NQA4_PENFR|nr:hypothetical protein N7527_005318 [Penicillium freii]KUM63606.1 hypothetical protein ACN42_g3478 [Penicillium freii]
MISGLVRQIMSQIATADVHQLHEMTDATAGIALAHENARMEGENGAGLEIAAIETDETETEMGAGPKTERGAPVGSAIRIDEVGNAPKNVKFRERSRSRSPHRNGTKAQSPPRGPKSDRKDPRSRDDGRRATGAQQGPARNEDEMDVDLKEDADEDEMEAQMRKTMGFSRFRTTKNTKIPGNDIYGVRKEKKIQYRQYMNRQGGFNRPLSPSR